MIIRIACQCQCFNHLLSLAWRAAVFTMWRGMLGDFDVDALEQPMSIVVFAIFQFVVVVLMMNLIIAIMGDSYEKVKENETTEALHERAKIIVDMELLCECITSIRRVLFS